METLSLVCPICCNETFDSRDALKYHLLSFVDNITCPACHARCDDIWDLTEHLGRECKDKPEPPPVVMPPPKKIKVEPPESGGEIEQVFLKSDFQEQEKSSLENHVEETPKGQNESHEDESQNLMYTCQMCNISFDSIEDHLAKYHEGEEVILETENDEDAPPNTEDGHEDNNSAYEDFQNEGDEDYDETSSQTTQRTVDEEQCYDKSGSAYTRKVVKIDKFWDNVNDSGAKVPLTEKYLLTNGKIRKISEKEAESVEDKSQIIEIHQCSRCALQFPNISHFNNHKCDVRSAKTPGKVKYKCSDCSEAYPSLVDLNDHMKSHIQTDPSGKLKKTITMGPQVCDICNTMFPSYKSLRLHKRMHEPVKSKEIEAPVQYNILGHKDDDDDDESVRRMFTCAVCNKVYDVGYEEIHMKSHNQEDDYVCSVCNRKFFTKENLEMHMKAHSNPKKFACSYCKKPFSTFSALQQHVTKQCTHRQYECQFCGRRFSRPHEKVKHERIHTGEKPHVCQICGKAFRVSYCLTLHMRTHSGTRPYHCEHCGKRFKSHSVYNHHMQTHSDVRNYQCPYCPKAFKTAVQLAGHKNSHTKPFACTECNRPFASLYAVRAHMETHKRENNLKFDCWLCGATYARAFALKDHMKSVHNEEYIQDTEVDDRILSALGEKATSQVEDDDETAEEHDEGHEDSAVDHVEEEEEEHQGEIKHYTKEEEERSGEEYEHMDYEEEQKATVERIESSVKA